MPADSGQERTEKATPKKLREAREKGQVPRSRELNTLVLLLVASSYFLFMGETLAEGIAKITIRGFQPLRSHIFDPGFMLTSLNLAMVNVLCLFTPFFFALLIAALIAPLALGGWILTAPSFQFQRLNPVKGMSKLFSWNGLVELFKALAKFLLLLAVAIGLMWNLSGELLGLSIEPLYQALGHSSHMVTWMFLSLSAVLIIVAAIDVPFQIWHHAKQLKMSRQEVRDELKETEGKPEVKSRIRSLQREIANRRMMEEVPKADVVITNPTHFAVAMRYDSDTMNAPYVVAKGRELIAASIREIAEKHGVPVVSSPVLARSLYFFAELNSEIPSDLYKAVAQVLAYVFQIRNGSRHGVHDPSFLANVSVPENMRRS
ncbi:MAG: flagellar biosynthesis protein FlhB [Thermodesulfobacteriota bacterium]|nr:flagellar biosynthesis protein FlhB [Thermodesulfobacteriota bacterium]